MTAATQSFNFDARAKGVGPPPFLLLGTLLFWGWQTDFLLVGALMGVILEGSRWIRLKWEFEDEDFRRIWLFCALVLLAAAVYAFTASDALNGFRGMIYNPNIRSERNAGTSLASATASVVKWLPMIFFLFIGAQCFSVRNGIPMETISVLKGWRWRKPRKQAGDTEAGQVMNISYPYLGVCLLAASVHPEEDKSYFWGICVLLGWSLWPYRSRRGGLAPWAAAMAIAIAAGYFGQAGLSRLQKYVENLNVFWFAGGGSRKGDAAETRMAIGKIGRIQNSSSILVRLETVGHSPAPSLLREGSYRIYREGSQSWVSGDVADEFTQVGESNETSYLLVPGKQDHGKVSISCFLPGGKGLLPVPQPVSRLDRLFVFNLQRSPGAALLAEGPGFVSFDANYGPGLSVDAPPILDNDLAIPPGELPGIQEAAGQIKLIGTNRLQILDSVAGFFAANFSYTNYQENPADAAVSQNSRRYGYNYGYHRGSRPAGTAAAAVAVRADGLRSSRDPLTRTNAGPENSLFRQYGFGAGFGGTNFWNSHRYRERILEMAERSRRGETPLSRFLLKTRRGHCEYFATATVLLLRSFGIPARYAVGYSVHEHSGDEYVVRGRDAHAWCLVWNAQSKAWENFDTTPATWVGIEDARASPFRGLLDVWSDVKFGLARIWWGQGNFRRYLLYALLPALGLLFGHIVFRGRRTRRRRAGESRENFSRPGLDSEFYMLEKKLGQRGLRRPAAKPVAVWMREMLAEPELAALREPLEKLLELHYRYRFDPAGLSAPEREILRREARQCAASL